MAHTTFSKPGKTMLEGGRLPLLALAEYAARESRRPRPIYTGHKWFARRLGCVFRSLLVAAGLEPDADFWEAYYGEADLTGKTVLDPFVGGGTSVVEASRLGASCIGVDIDPVACAVTDFEAKAGTMPDLSEALEELKASLGTRLQTFHEARGPSGELMTVLHHFWVQRVECPSCGVTVDAHPNFVLAEDKEDCWVICSHCDHLEKRRAGAERFRCSRCRRMTTVREGNVVYGRIRCPACGNKEPLITISRNSGKSPTWHLFAQELIPSGSFRKVVPMTERILVAADEDAREAYVRAAAELDTLRNAAEISLPDAPIADIPRDDDRVIAYGYRAWTDLFNARQLLHLGLLHQEIMKLDAAVRRPFAIAFSNHLTTNCMMAAYAAGWRRLTPLFSIRAFRHIQRPVELNPWVDGTGRGTFPNTIRRLVRAREYATDPKEPSEGGAFISVPARPPVKAPRILNQSSCHLTGIDSRSVDIVLTDPPYFDNINYSQLSEFFVPWMHHTGLTGAARTASVVEESLNARRADPSSADAFVDGLSRVFQEVRRVLKPDGLVVFTYRHTQPEAWESLARAIAKSRLRVSAVFPVPGEAGVGLHSHQGSGLWDAVFVLRSADREACADSLLVSTEAVRNSEADVERWEQELAGASIDFAAPDVRALQAAHLVAAALAPDHPLQPTQPLHDALRQIS
jgi:putative DNA methylase